MSSLVVTVAIRKSGPAVYGFVLLPDIMLISNGEPMPAILLADEIRANMAEGGNGASRTKDGGELMKMAKK